MGELLPLGIGDLSVGAGDILRDVGIATEMGAERLAFDELERGLFADVPSTQFSNEVLPSVDIPEELGSLRNDGLITTEQINQYQAGLDNFPEELNSQLESEFGELTDDEFQDAVGRPDPDELDDDEFQDAVSRPQEPERTRVPEGEDPLAPVDEPTTEQIEQATTTISDGIEDIFSGEEFQEARETLGDRALRDLQNVARQSIVDGTANQLARYIGKKGRDIIDWFLGKLKDFLIALLKAMGIIVGAFTSYNIGSEVIANRRARAKAEREREEIVKEVESRLGTNSGKMNPEVRVNFGKESLLETSQGDLYYDSTDNILVVSYRGTDFSRLGDRPDLALIDIINDLNMGTDSYMGLLVHAGFLRMFLESLPEIKEFINQYMDNDTIVYTTGHSAGSPSAILLAYTINQHRKNHNAVAYVFGSPRFLIEGKSVEQMNSVVPHIFRIDADNDLIPYLPPRIKPNPLPQYMHVGTEYVFKSDYLGEYEIEKGDTRTARSLSDLGSILYKIMFLYTGAGDYVMSDGSSLLGRLIEARRLLNPVTFLEEVKDVGRGILFNLDLIENPYIDRSRYNFRNSPMRTSRTMRENIAKQIDSIKAGFRNSWGDKMKKMNSILFNMETSIRQLDYEAYELAFDMDAFKTSRETLRIKDRFLRAGIPEEAVNNYLTSIFDVTYNRGENFKQELINNFGERIGTAIGNTFGNYLTFRTAMINLGFATGIALALNFFIQGQYNRFLGHRMVNYDKILSAFTKGKSILKHSIKNESEIIGEHDIKTDEGVFKRTEKIHFKRNVYESDGMNFTPHYYDGEIYMNHIPYDLNSAIMGYYLYKPNEFNSGTPVKGFVIY